MYEVLKYIHDNLDRKLTEKEVAAAFGYSRWSFCTIFRRFTGSSFVEYVRRYKLSLAAIDILDGKKVIEVAMRYGYETPSGFNKAFLTEFGCYPREFKHQNQDAMLRYKERRDKMIPLSDRCAALRKAAIENADAAYRVAHRDLWFAKGLVASKTSDRTTQAAEALASVIENAPPHIREGELIVGYNYSEDEYGDILPYLSDEDAVFYREEGIPAMCAFLQHGSCDPVMGVVGKTESERLLTEEWAGIGRCIGDNHTVIGYREVLEHGFEGLLDRVLAYKEKNGVSPFYSGLERVCRAAIGFGERYAARAEKMAQDESLSMEMREEMQKVAAVCRRVPRYPARSFWEALQSLFFAHIFNTWEDHINANSLGRLDQILYPYYRADIESGAITKELAAELLACFWIKLYRSYDVQQSAVGGCTPEGKDAVNELSYMMLDVTEQLDFVRCLSVRYHKNTDKAFMRRALEVVGHLQKGVPFFFNDGVLIPALTAKGISLADARDYTQIGCVETVIPGKSNPHAVTGQTNLLKALEYALFDGESLVNPGKKPGLSTGRVESYEELMAATLRQIEHILDVTCRKVKQARDIYSLTDPKPYKSLLTAGCVETGRDFNDGGARYDYYQIMLGGIPNLADSLMALQRFVFRERRYTLDDVRHALKNNYPDEKMRLVFLNKSPKFGNDIDEVDAIAAEISSYACDCLERLSEKYGLSFHPQLFTYLWLVEHGEKTGASPDGRRAGENIAYSISPMQGRDFNGFTALINSLCRLPTHRAPGSASAIVEVDPKLFADSNIDLFVDIMLVAAEKGVSNVQFNIIDADMLLDAQKNPDKYTSLAVRVSGFSQKFNLIDKKLQDHIIGRTKHKSL